MINSNLPTTRTESSTKNSVVPAQKKSLLQNEKFLLVSGSTLAVAALGTYFLIHHIFISIGLGFIAFIAFASQQLVKKSLMLTQGLSPSPSAFSPAGLQIEEAKKQISKVKFLENVETEGQRAANQGEQLLSQYKNLLQILATKFEKTELTYGRYQDSIDLMCLSIAENLLNTKNLLDNLNITKKTAPQQATEQLVSVNKILDSTDAALQQLSTLFKSLNEINTKDHYRLQLDSAIEQIKDLSERAKNYSSKN